MSHCQAEYDAWQQAEEEAYNAYVTWYECEFGSGMAQTMDNRVSRTSTHTGKSRYQILCEHVIGRTKEDVEKWTQLP